jgi:hypothetical protein
MKFLMSWKLTIKPGTTATPKIGNPVVSMRLASMSELGQTRTFADIRDKSALPLKSGHYANSIYQVSGAIVSLMAPPKPSAAIASAISIAFFSLVCPRRLG